MRGTPPAQAHTTTPAAAPGRTRGHSQSRRRPCDPPPPTASPPARLALVRQVTALARLDYEALRNEWRRLFGTEPPLYGKELLRQRVAYRIQELAYGGLPDATRERLRSIVEPPPKATPGPVCGAILVRVFKGMRHEVTVLADGFQFQGRHWKSLSAIAKAIVGSQRDGPLFFGLRKKVRRRHA